MSDQNAAAWESATMQNLGPLLSEEASQSVWDALLNYRTDKDVSKVASGIRKAVAGFGARVLDIAESAIDRLPKPEKKPTTKPAGTV